MTLYRLKSEDGMYYYAANRFVNEPAAPYFQEHAAKWLQKMLKEVLGIETLLEKYECT